VKKTELHTKYVHFELVDDILILTYNADLEITLDIAREVVRSRLEFTGSRAYPLLILDDGVKSMSKEARDYFSSDAGTEGVKAGAMLLKSVFSTFLVNFFLKVTQPKIPAKIFTEKAKAIEWLEQYK